MSQQENTPTTNKKQPWYKKPWVITLGVVVLFVALSFAYFYPAAFEGRVLFQMDGAAAAGTGRDAKLMQETTGEVSRWTGSLFGGMPTYQISPSYPSVVPLRTAGEVYRLQWPLNLMPGDTYLLLMMLLGGYIFMRSWGTRRRLSVLGAILWTFSSYFLILIDAGHLWKLLALAYIPPTIAGMVYAFHRKKYLVGFLLMAFFSALQIYSNHIQMSYYFAFLMAGMVIAWAVEAYRGKEWVHFGKALGVVVLGGIVGILINGSTLYHTWEYQQETMRGGKQISVLTGEGTSDKGLDKQYITQWSYGIDEMLTFLIPDAKGGATGMIGAAEVAKHNVPVQDAAFVAQQNRYWGDQPFTAGPVYVGAFVLALAFFGIFASKGPMRWAMIVVTILTIMLSWGHNLMWLTEFFIDHVPLYNKFRTPSSILVVAELTIPIFAIWGLSLILSNPRIIQTQKWATISALALTLGVALLMWVAPALSGGFLSKMEEATFAQYTAQMPQLAPLIDQLEAVRKGIFRADALRSILIIAAGAAVLYLFTKQKLSAQWTIALVTVLCLVDLWTVDKRYLNDAKYLPKGQVAARVQHKTPVDDLILQDTTQYRVMNLAVNTFNDATTSYNHRSIGGYHAAKLQRYQDLIDGYLSRMDPNVLRALNTKYYILPDSVQGVKLITDHEVYGDAWFVHEVKKVGSPDEEFVALKEVPLNDVAVVAPPFDTQAPATIYRDSLSVVTLTHYRPNEIRYRTDNSGDGLVVFSEIYYPHGWTATIDGEESSLLRADYTLRALEVPKGTHEIVLTFHPRSLVITEAIAIGASILLLLVGIVAIGIYFYNQRKEAL